ncbi:MAG: tRNA pseudouridine(38-40) synthase TruA [Acidiferrobacteraceae bacterium]
MSEPAPTQRIAAVLEYDGSGFRGWQHQGDGRSLQEAVEHALAHVADHPVRVVVAGRTDTGVHALRQVIHFDPDATRPDHSWLRGANSQLPRGISFLWLRPVDPTFHARFSALARHYRYVILNRPVRPSLLAHRVSWEYRQLDVERMQEAALALVGTHDFTSFRAIQCQAKSPVRELSRLEIARRGDLVTIDVSANGFLHHMVRNIAGVLMAIGARERVPGWAGEVLRARDRTRGGVTAPPDGLYLLGVDYPERFGIPSAPGTQDDGPLVPFNLRPVAPPL